MRSALAGMGAESEVPGRAGHPFGSAEGLGRFGTERPSVAADHGDAHAAASAVASAILAWPVKSTMMTRTAGGAPSWPPAFLAFLAGYLGAEPAEHAGGAGAQFAAGGGEQAGLVPEFGRVPGGVRLCDVFC